VIARELGEAIDHVLADLGFDAPRARRAVGGGAERFDVVESDRSD